jgi:hypothetical protein
MMPIADGCASRWEEAACRNLCDACACRPFPLLTLIATIFNPTS